LIHGGEGGRSREHETKEKERHFHPISTEGKGKEAGDTTKEGGDKSSDAGGKRGEEK